MIKPDRRLVRRLRTRVRTEVKASPALLRESRRVRRPWSRELTLNSLRGVVPLIIVGITLSDSLRGFVAPCLAIWTLGLTLLRAGQIAGVLHGPALSVYTALPVSDATVFRHQLMLVGRAGAWLALDWLGFGLAAAAHRGDVASWVAAPLFATGQAVTAVAVAWFLVDWRPRLPFGPIGVFLIASLWLFAQVAGGGTAAAFVAPFLHALLRTTPSGWLVLAHENLLSGGSWGWLVGVLFTVASSVALFRAVNRTRSTFTLEATDGDVAADADEASSPPAFGEPPVTDTSDVEEHEGALRRASTPRTGYAPDAAELAKWRDRIEDVLTTPPGLALFRRGWLEARTTRLLSLKQRVLIDFLLPQSPRWGRLWLGALGLILLAAGVRGGGYNAEWLVWLPGVALVLFALPTFGGTWMGLRPVVSSSGHIGLHAFAPVGFFPLAWTILTVNMLRCVYALPLIVLAVRYGYTAAPLPWGQTFRASASVLVILLTLLPTWIGLDSRRRPTTVPHAGGCGLS